MSPEKDMEMARTVAAAVAAAGGRVYYVGGIVRDRLLGLSNKDVDIEVHGVSVESLESILDSIGERIEFGRSFGVYNLRGYALDIAMPRREECIGEKHTDFKIDVDPYIGTMSAAKRRDFTMNALMEDVLTGEIIDHFGGREDLAKKTLRHVNDESFAEDPLRVFRAAQFAARFGFSVAGETLEYCRGMDLTALSSERVFEELKKALLKSATPSVFFDVLRKMGHLAHWFPEVEALIGIEQDPVHHAEGDVYTHTMMVLDAAASMREGANYPLGFMLSALVHDFGKPATTEVIDGRIHAYGHEALGLPVVREFLGRITNERRLIQYVLNMTEHHMKPNVLAGVRASVKSTNKMFDRAVDPHDLLMLAAADGLGRLPLRDESENEQFLVERLAVFDEYMSRPFVQGKDLTSAGFTPGDYFTELLEYAHKLRLAGVPKESAMKQVQAYYRKEYKGK